MRGCVRFETALHRTYEGAVKSVKQYIGDSENASPTEQADAFEKLNEELIPDRVGGHISLGEKESVDFFTCEIGD
jgi:hypothetical protein